DISGNPTLGAKSPYTSFSVFGSTFGPGFTSSQYFYLDPEHWDTNGQGFDYSVSINRPSGNHLRDFVAHIGVFNDELRFDASNNSSHACVGSKLNTPNRYAITENGWYEIEHVFYDDDGLRSVDINL